MLMQEILKPLDEIEARLSKLDGEVKPMKRSNTREDYYEALPKVMKPLKRAHLTMIFDELTQGGLLPRPVTEAGLGMMLRKLAEEGFINRLQESVYVYDPKTSSTGGSVLMLDVEDAA